MAAADGDAPQHLAFLSRAAEEPRRYGLFALLKGLEARARHLPRIGASRLPSQNIVDLAQTPSLSFPGPTLERIEVRRGRAYAEGYWLGLTGPMGPLPLHLSEFAAFERRYGKKRPYGRFLDLLAGRMLQFFYRAWADSNPVAHAERPHDDRFSAYVAALTGAPESVPDDAAFPARARLHYAALYASRRSASAVQDALAHLLRTHVRILEFQPRWRDIEPGDNTRVGRGFASLGRDTVAGRRVRGVMDAFRVQISVDTLAEYEDFLPTGRKFQIAAEALDAFAPSHLEWDIQLVLPAREIRPTRLDGRMRMGWTTWLGSAVAEDGSRSDTRLGRSARRLGRASRGKRTT
jgi:type VI secretion system ImpH/TssG family protein